MTNVPLVQMEDSIISVNVLKSVQILIIIIMILTCVNHVIIPVTLVTLVEKIIVYLVYLQDSYMITDVKAHVQKELTVFLIQENV